MDDGATQLNATDNSSDRDGVRLQVVKSKATIEKSPALLLDRFRDCGAGVFCCGEFVFSEYRVLNTFDSFHALACIYRG